MEIEKIYGIVEVFGKVVEDWASDHEHDSDRPGVSG